jgi:hypothetical protein
MAALTFIYVAKRLHGKAQGFNEPLISFGKRANSVAHVAQCAVCFSSKSYGIFFPASVVPQPIVFPHHLHSASFDAMTGIDPLTMITV